MKYAGMKAFRGMAVIKWLWGSWERGSGLEIGRRLGWA